MKVYIGIGLNKRKYYAHVVPAEDKFNIKQKSENKINKKYTK